METNVNTQKMKWYIISCYSGQEDRVANLVREAIEANQIQDKVPQVLVPTQKEFVIKDGKKREVEKKTFPGYLLIQMDMSDDVWGIIKNVDGVTRFVGGSQRKPTPISDDEVKSIIEYQKVTQTSYSANFAVGDTVKIVDGWLKDHVGRVSDINDKKGKLTVSVDFLGRETPVQLDFLQVARL